MDSCHIFNFLFGTKKATTELSKCFNNITGQRKSKNHLTKKNDNSSTTSNENKSESSSSCDLSSKENQPPLSPLKQLQAKLIGLAPGFNNNNSNNSTRIKQPNENLTTESEQQNINCDLKCGTYRARLVKLVEEEDIANDKSKNNSNNDNDTTIKEREILLNSKSQVTIIENPSDSYKANHMSLQNITDTKLVQDSLNTFLSDDKKHHYSDKNDESITNRDNIDINKNNSNNDIRTKAQATFRPVVMYSDDDSEKERQKFVSSSAEVYKLVSEYGQARAKLRRVSSISIDGETNNYLEDNDQTIKVDNNNNNKVPQLDKNNTQDKRSIFVRNLVKSIESNGKFEDVDFDNNDILGRPQQQQTQKQQQHGYMKPVTFVKPMPPPTPPKPILSNITKTSSPQIMGHQNRYINFQSNLEKPMNIQQLFQDENFLTRFFFDKLEPLDRCVAAQVCHLWRNILYANQNYWKDLINVINCTQLRREHLVECIMNTLQSAKLKQQQKITIKDELKDKEKNNSNANQIDVQKPYSIDSYFDFDQDDIWKIQELCNKFTTNHHRIHSQSYRQHMINSDSNEQTNCNNNIIVNGNGTNNCMTASKSSSIPSQISSTLSSFSISSILSPLSESSRIDSIKEKLYMSLDNRGFDALCLFGATDDDIEDIVYKIPVSAHKRITVCRLNNCSLTDRGIDLLTTTFDKIEELELTGCNEITNAIELKSLIDLKRLIITDCINIADGIAQNLLPIANQLNELTIQAYHLTDTFLEYLSLNSDIERLTKLELPNCKEITNQSLVTMAKHFTQLEVLSVSGSTKISDDGIEILAEQARKLRCLDLSWCTRITDASLECIACDLGDTLTDLILDRNVHITDVGIGYLSTMSRLTLLHIRWCPRITDIGLESLLGVSSLKYLSLAGIHQITARSLLCLVETELEEIELTNCPAVNGDLIMFLSAQLPECNIIF